MEVTKSLNLELSNRLRALRVQLWHELENLGWRKLWYDSTVHVPFNTQLIHQLNEEKEVKLIQGDVILRQTDKIPKGAKLKETKTLQESAVTGNCHFFAKGSAVKIFETKEEKFVEVSKASKLLHGKKDGGAGDHLALSVPKGIYKVSIVREWDYLFHEARRVID